MPRQSSFERNVRRYYLFSALTSSLLWLPIWIIFLQRRGLSLSQIGTLETLAWIAMAAMEVPTGVVADTYGRRASLALGALLDGLAMFALLTRVLSPIFLVGYVLWNVSATFVSGAGDALLYDSAKAAGHEHGFTGIAGRNLAIVQAAGGLAGLLGSAIAVWDMRPCFALTGLLAFAAAGVALALREPPRGELAGRRSGYRENLRAGVRIAVRLPRVRYIILLGATTSVFTILLGALLVQPYCQAVGLPVWLLGGVVLLTNAGAMLGSSLAGRAERRLGRMRLLVGVPAAVVALQALLWLAAAPAAAILFAGVALAFALVQPVLSALLNDAIPSAQRATVISLQALLSGATVGVLQLALFTLAARTSAPLAIGIAGLLLTVMVAPVLLLLRRASADPQPAATLPIAHGLAAS